MSLWLFLTEELKLIYRHFILIQREVTFTHNYLRHAQFLFSFLAICSQSSRLYRSTLSTETDIPFNIFLLFLKVLIFPVSS